jgi:hypothetical protein
MCHIGILMSQAGVLGDRAKRPRRSRDQVESRWSGWVLNTIEMRPLRVIVPTF